MSLITSRLTQNVPDAAAFKRMLKAGLDAEMWLQFHSANGAVAGVIFANVQPDINGDYDFVHMNALNKRMASDVAALALYQHGNVKFFPTRDVGRELAVIDGGKIAAGGAS